MVKFYTLSSAAGLIRTNKFNEKKDAICVGSYRAEYLNFPVKIYAHDEDGDKECILVCNPDGSAEKPLGMGSEPQDMGNSSGVANRESAHILLAAFDDQPITTFRLRAAISETQVQALEKAAECDIGMVSAETFNAFTQEPKKIHAIETQLAAWSLELDDIVDASLKRNKAHAALEAQEQMTTVTSARKAHLAARASRLPELRVRASSRFGNDHKFMAHCEMGAAKDKKSPVIHVHVDGTKVGEAKDEISAKKMMAEHAEKSFSKFLRKELG